MPTGTLALTGSVAGVTINASVSRTETGQISHEVTLTAGLAGTLSTRTDNDTGILTVTAGHGIVGTDVIDIYWTGGRRYGAVVDSVTATTITFGTVTVGSGDNLPVVDTAIVVAKQQTVDTDFDGDNLKMIVGYADQRAHLHFQENDGTSIASVDLAANEPWWWFSDNGFSNALTGDPVGAIKVTNGTTTAATLRLGLIYDSA